MIAVGGPPDFGKAAPGRPTRVDQLGSPTEAKPRAAGPKGVGPDLLEARRRDRPSGRKDFPGDRQPGETAALRSKNRPVAQRGEKQLEPLWKRGLNG